MNAATQAKFVREKVSQLLDDYPETRDSDRTLLLKYWEHVDNINLDNIREEFVNSTGAESITRARRSVQSAGLFLPTNDEVLKRRRMLADETRQHYATTN